MRFYKEKCEDKTVYKIESETGSGRMTSYAVFPGIHLIYNDFQDFACFDSDNSRSDLIEINHCLRGRFECEFQNNKMIYVGEGDFAVNSFGNPIRQASFPLGFYQGITVQVDFSQAGTAVRQLFGEDFIDFDMLAKRLCHSDECFYLRSNQAIDHIFSELYNVDLEIQSAYFKIKVLELLLFLGSKKIQSSAGTKKYYEKALVDIVKQAQRYLIAHVEEHITIERLILKYNVGRTLFLN